MTWSSTISYGGVTYSVPHTLVDETVWVRVDGDEIVAVHVSETSGAVEVSRHGRSTPGTPRIDDAHYPPPPAGALHRQPKAANPAEAEFLALGEGERDAHEYLRRLEEVLIRTLADYGIEAFRHPPHTGVWVDSGEGPRKIAAIGVRLSRWVTSHGFALNVDCDLSDFEVIVPCGISDYAVTSMSQVLGRPVDLDDVASRVPAHFERVFGRTIPTGVEVG